jgi:thiol:disulfide interchange protein DsbA
MNRRDSLHCLAAGLALASPTGALFAQGAPGALQEGRDYKRVESPVAVPDGKVDVVEFFGYWCPHCNAFEPALDAWARKLPPAQVSFRRVPVVFNAAHEVYQRLYYALESLGLVDNLHRKVFAAVHVQHVSFIKDADVAAWVSANGADGAKVVEAMKSFSIASKLRQARALADGFRIDGVPTLGIQGRYMTSPSIAGGPERALAVSDALIAQHSKKA